MRRPVYPRSRIHATGSAELQAFNGMRWFSSAVVCGSNERWHTARSMHPGTTDLEISTDAARLDVTLIHRWLSTESYWAQGRARDEVERSIAHSLCFGAYCSEGQIGFGRVVTDYTVFAYLMDVFVVSEWQGKGVGERLVAAIVGHDRLRDLPLMLLRTKDAHGLYTRFGFVPPARPQELMARYRPE